MQSQVSNPNDFKVVTFHNSTDFGFTSEMGCMYDGRPIFGRNGLAGIEAGEKIVLPYHIGHRLAVNLAKRVLNTSPAATVDPKGVPTGVPIWSESRLKELAVSFITDLYSEAKPVQQSQTDILMQKVEEYRKFNQELAAKVDAMENKTSPVAPALGQSEALKVYQDKQEVIAELEKRGLSHDKRKSKADLEKLLI